MTIPKGLLIAGGLGALAIGGLMLFKGGDKPKEGEGAGDPATGGDVAAGTGPATGTTGMPGTAGALPNAGTPDMGGTGAGQLAGGQQMGPYTVFPDPQSGMQLVIETATQNPVGILDEQGNLIPVQRDASGNLTIAPQGGMPTGGLDAGSSASSGQLMPGTGTAGPSTAQSQYGPLAAALFAQAGNPAVGSASSDAMAGTGALAPQGSTLGATPSIGAPQVQAQQAGAYSIVADPASGQQVVIETATQQPVGVLDAQGNVIPLSPEPTTAATLGVPSAQPQPQLQAPAVGTAGIGAGSMPSAGVAGPPDGGPAFTGAGM